MKHIIALTTLAAAASAQTAPAAGLNYNLVGFSRSSTENTLSVQLALGQSNFLVGFSATSNDLGNRPNNGQLSVGYVFKGVTNGIDATVGVLQADGIPGISNTAYSIGLRRALNEVYQGLEIAGGYAGTLSSGHLATFTYAGANGVAESASFVELSYNINKTFSAAVGLTKFANYDRQTVFSVRAGF